MLQCGRNFCVAEIGMSGLIPPLGGMLQCGRNFCVAEIFADLYEQQHATALQCGRNFCVAEMSIPRVLIVYEGYASMWPQLLRCGNKCGIYPLRDLPVCFNVAATFALRKFDTSSRRGHKPR